MIGDRRDFVGYVPRDAADSGFSSANGSSAAVGVRNAPYGSTVLAAPPPARGRPYTATALAPSEVALKEVIPRTLLTPRVASRRVR